MLPSIPFTIESAPCFHYNLAASARDFVLVPPLDRVAVGINAVGLTTDSLEAKRPLKRRVF